jgi:hypothetical protein
MELEGAAGPDLRISAIEDSDGGSGRTFHAQCQVFNGNGETFSFVVPVTPGPRSTLEVDEVRRVVKVTTQTGERPADFSVALERSHDLGRSWLPSSTPISQGPFQRVVTEIPLSAAGECASDVHVRASCTSACGSLASLDRSFPAPLALSPCGPAGIDPTDFWCSSCPPEVVFAQSDFGESDPSFVVRRAVPNAGWGVRWLFLAPTGVEGVVVNDGPTGRGSSVASGATTPELRIDSPSGLDAGRYAMIVRPPSDVCSYEFCAAIVTVSRRDSIPPYCPRLLSNPSSRTVCPGEGDFTLSASFSTGDQLAWWLDGYLPLQGETGEVEIDNGSGDRVAFAWSGGTSGSLAVLGYEAEGAHTLTASVSTNCTFGGESLPAVLWQPGSERRCGGCRPDLNGDMAVDGIDLGMLLAAWGTGSVSADLNADGAVDGVDLGLLLAAWGVCP